MCRGEKMGIHFMRKERVPEHAFEVGLRVTQVFSFEDTVVFLIAD